MMRRVDDDNTANTIAGGGAAAPPLLLSPTRSSNSLHNTFTTGSSGGLSPRLVGPGANNNDAPSSLFMPASRTGSGTSGEAVVPPTAVILGAETTASRRRPRGLSGTNNNSGAATADVILGSQHQPQTTVTALGPYAASTPVGTAPTSTPFPAAPLLPLSPQQPPLQQQGRQRSTARNTTTATSGVGASSSSPPRYVSNYSSNNNGTFLGELFSCLRFVCFTRRIALLVGLLLFIIIGNYWLLIQHLHDQHDDVTTSTATSHRPEGNGAERPLLDQPSSLSPRPLQRPPVRVADASAIGSNGGRSADEEDTSLRTSGEDRIAVDSATWFGYTSMDDVIHYRVDADKHWGPEDPILAIQSTLRYLYAHSANHLRQRLSSASEISTVESADLPSSSLLFLEEQWTNLLTNISSDLLPTNTGSSDKDAPEQKKNTKRKKDKKKNNDDQKTQYSAYRVYKSHQLFHRGTGCNLLRIPFLPADDARCIQYMSTRANWLELRPLAMEFDQRTIKYEVIFKDIDFKKEIFSEWNRTFFTLLHFASSSSSETATIKDHPPPDFLDDLILFAAVSTSSTTTDDKNNERTLLQQVVRLVLRLLLLHQKQQSEGAIKQLPSSPTKGLIQETRSAVADVLTRLHSNLYSENNEKSADYGNEDGEAPPLLSKLLSESLPRIKLSTIVKVPQRLFPYEAFSEVGAFYTDRLLGIDRIPPTAWGCIPVRDIQTATLQYKDSVGTVEEFLQESGVKDYSQWIEKDLLNFTLGMKWQEVTFEDPEAFHSSHDHQNHNDNSDAIEASEKTSRKGGNAGNKLPCIGVSMQLKVADVGHLLDTALSIPYRSHNDSWFRYFDVIHNRNKDALTADDRDRMLRILRHHAEDKDRDIDAGQENEKVTDFINLLEGNPTIQRHVENMRRSGGAGSISTGNSISDWNPAWYNRTHEHWLHHARQQQELQQPEQALKNGGESDKDDNAHLRHRRASTAAAVYFRDNDARWDVSSAHFPLEKALVSTRHVAGMLANNSFDLARGKEGGISTATTTRTYTAGRERGILPDALIAPSFLTEKYLASILHIAEITMFDFITGNGDRSPNKNNFVVGGCTLYHHHHHRRQQQQRRGGKEKSPKQNEDNNKMKLIDSTILAMLQKEVQDHFSNGSVVVAGSHAIQQVVDALDRLVFDQLPRSSDDSKDRDRQIVDHFAAIGSSTSPAAPLSFDLLGERLRLRRLLSGRSLPTNTDNNNLQWNADAALVTQQTDLDQNDVDHHRYETAQAQYEFTILQHLLQRALGEQEDDYQAAVAEGGSGGCQDVPSRNAVALRHPGPPTYVHLDQGMAFYGTPHRSAMLSSFKTGGGKKKAAGAAAGSTSALAALPESVFFASGDGAVSSSSAMDFVIPVPAALAATGYDGVYPPHFCLFRHGLLKRAILLLGVVPKGIKASDLRKSSTTSSIKEETESFADIDFDHPSILQNDPSFWSAFPPDPSASSSPRWRDAATSFRHLSFALKVMHEKDLVGGGDTKTLLHLLLGDKLPKVVKTFIDGSTLRQAAKRMLKTVLLFHACSTSIPPPPVTSAQQQPQQGDGTPTYFDPAVLRPFMIAP